MPLRPKHNTWAEFCVKHSCLSQLCWDRLTSPLCPSLEMSSCFFGGMHLMNSATSKYHNYEQSIAMSFSKSRPKGAAHWRLHQLLKSAGAPSPHYVCFILHIPAIILTHSGARSTFKSNLGTGKHPFSLFVSLCLCFKLLHMLPLKLN